jgi:hypothetical protein
MRQRLAPLTALLVDFNPGALAAPPAFLCDVLVVMLSGATLGALEWSLARWADFGSPELVFVADGAVAQSTASALAAAGAQYILSGRNGLPWLLQHAPALSAYARAQRSLAQAAARIPGATRPIPCVEDVKEIPGLFQAEQDFRRSYVQLLMMRSPSRKHAARAAGVPYRTFCHVLEKLGLSMVGR